MRPWALIGTAGCFSTAQQPPKPPLHEQYVTVGADLRHTRPTEGWLRLSQQGKVAEAAPALAPWLDSFAAERAETLLAVHRQLRDGPRIKGLKYDVRRQLLVDVLGVYVLLPSGPS